jgi:hopanoid biosynthesis associated protein HpnK
MASRLILNGDDFGMSPEVNAGILLAHTEGLLTSASLMVNGRAAPEAVDLARRHPTLAVGLHLVLIQGSSTLGPAEIPHLVDGEGNFGDAPLSLGLRYFFKPGIERQIESEVRAQIEKFLAFGLPLSHVDGHLHFHLHPTIFKILLKLSKEYPIPAVRLTRDRFWVNIRFDRGRLGIKTIHYILFALLSRYAEKGLEKHGIAHAERVYGLLQSGRMDERYLLYILERLESGASEIYFHPATGGFDLQKRFMPDYRHKEELAALMSPKAKEAFKLLGVEPIGPLALSR